MHILCPNCISERCLASKGLRAPRPLRRTMTAAGRRRCTMQRWSKSEVLQIMAPANDPLACFGNSSPSSSSNDNNCGNYDDNRDHARRLVERHNDNTPPPPPPPVAPTIDLKENSARGISSLLFIFKDRKTDLVFGFKDFIFSHEPSSWQLMS